MEKSLFDAITDLNDIQVNLRKLGTSRRSQKSQLVNTQIQRAALLYEHIILLVNEIGSVDYELVEKVNQIRFSLLY